MGTAPKHFSAGPGPKLAVRDSVVALLLLPGERYLMQLRDDRPDIIYPGHWGCFGGALHEPGEDPLTALKRELQEELELEIATAAQFVKLDFDLSASGGGRFFRMYFEVPVTEDQVRQMRLHEGADMRAFGADELLHRPWVSHHDAFAIWLHGAGPRFSPRHNALSGVN